MKTQSSAHVTWLHVACSNVWMEVYWKGSTKLKFTSLSDTGIHVEGWALSTAVARCVVRSSFSPQQIWFSDFDPFHQICLSGVSDDSIVKLFVTGSAVLWTHQVTTVFSLVIAACHTTAVKVSEVFVFLTTGLCAQPFPAELGDPGSSQRRVQAGERGNVHACLCVCVWGGGRLRCVCVLGEAHIPSHLSWRKCMNAHVCVFSGVSPTWTWLYVSVLSFRHGGYPASGLANGLQPDPRGPVGAGRQLPLSGHEALLHPGLHQHLQLHLHQYLQQPFHQHDLHPQPTAVWPPGQHGLHLQLQESRWTKYVSLSVVGSFDLSYHWATQTMCYLCWPGSTSVAGYTNVCLNMLNAGLLAWSHLLCRLFPVFRFNQTGARIAPTVYREQPLVFQTARWPFSCNAEHRVPCVRGQSLWFPLWRACLRGL